LSYKRVNSCRRSDACNAIIPFHEDGYD